MPKVTCALLFRVTVQDMFETLVNNLKEVSEVQRILIIFRNGYRDGDSVRSYLNPFLLDLETFLSERMVSHIFGLLQLTSLQCMLIHLNYIKPTAHSIRRNIGTRQMRFPSIIPHARYLLVDKSWT